MLPLRITKYHFLLLHTGCAQCIVKSVPAECYNQPLPDETHSKMTETVAKIVCDAHAILQHNGVCEPLNK